MRVPVIVRVDNLQTDPDGKSEHVVANYKGSMLVNDGRCVVGYEETLPGDNKQSKPVKCMLKFSDKKIELNKNGDLSYNMVFVEGERVKFLYRTAFGTIDMAVETLSLITGGDIGKGLTAEIKYLLDMNGYALKCELNLSVDPVVEMRPGK